MKTSVLIVGVGNMGGALARGLSHSAFAKEVDLKLCDIHKDRLSSIASELSSVTIKDLDEGERKEDVIILCVKPQDLPKVADKLTGALHDKTLIISIIAGVTTDDIAEQFDFDGAIVRTMPNIAATVGCAATAMCANENCTDAQKMLAEKIFSAIGDAAWTQEALMDAVTGLSGSGPAYIYMVVEALTDGGVKMGIPRDLSLKLATQTVLGSAMLVKKTGIHPAILRDQVTTPGGTTINAIHDLESHGLRSMLISAVGIATEKSRELREKRKKRPS